MISRRAQRAFYANDFSMLNPTIWANELILTLRRNMVMGNLVTRDFQDVPAIFGQLVNAYIPGTFAMTRKGAPCENVVIQDATGTTMQVALDQWPQVAFFICDGEEDRNFRDMLEQQFRPALDAFASGIDLILGGQVYRFMENWAGRLLQVDETNIKDFVLEAREVMNRNNAPLAGRTMLLTPGTETEALKLDSIITADKTGDGGTALREARLGRKYGFDFISSNGQPEVTTGQTVITAAVNNLAGYPVGTTVLTMDTVAGGTPAAGQWAMIAGDDSPQHVTASNGTTSITISPGLRRTVADNAVITIIKPGAVNNVGGYIGTTISPRVIGWAKEILLDGLANSPPRIGQGVTFGTQNDVYTIIKLKIINSGAGTFGIELDRPLVTAITDDMTVNFLPAGKYNMAIIRQAMALINRPLNKPRTGVISRVMSDPINRVSIRATISYDPVKQGHLVVLDTLIGVAFLNPDLAVVMGG